MLFQSTFLYLIHPLFQAYSLICKKLEDEDLARVERRGSEREEEGGGRKEGLALRLVIPASQCGSLIGKGGSKIKEIREVTGCSVQVASDPLPNSTERMVTVVGSRDAVTQCVYHVCCVMLESPAKGTTVQYTPGRGGFPPGGPMMHRGEGRGPPNPLVSLLTMGGGDGGSTLAAIASIAGSQIRRHEMRNREERGMGPGMEGREATHQMTVTNELIGSVIGKSGSKIAEIRQMSGAMIRISRSDDPSAPAEEERQINITGNPDSVALAKSLINMSLDLHKVAGGSHVLALSCPSFFVKFFCVFPLPGLFTVLVFKRVLAQFNEFYQDYGNISCFFIVI